MEASSQNPGCGLSADIFDLPKFKLLISYDNKSRVRLQFIYVVGRSTNIKCNALAHFPAEMQLPFEIFGKK